MIISVINRTNGLVKDKEIQFAIRAINRQINEDFLPYWSFGASLRLEGSKILLTLVTLQNGPLTTIIRSDCILYGIPQVDCQMQRCYFGV